MGVHRDLSGEQIHVPFALTYPDATARTSATGLTVNDVGKFALQSNDHTLWMLIDESPVTWKEVNATESNWGNIQGSLSNQVDLYTILNAKQATLESGTNIKTINNQSIIGSGNLAISAGSSDLDGLTDVIVSTPATGDILQYNGANWVNAQIEAGSGIEIPYQNDAPSNPSDGDVWIDKDTDPPIFYVWNSTSSAWKAVGDGVGGGATQLNDLTDVIISTPSSGQSIIYNGTNWINSTVSSSESASILQQTEPPSNPQAGDLWLDTDGTGSEVYNCSMLVAEYTVSGSAVSSVTFSDLDGNTDGGYVLEICIVSNSINSDVYLKFNNLTASSYYTEYYYAINTTSMSGLLDSGVATGAWIGGITTNTTSILSSITDVVAAGGYVNAMARFRYYTGTQEITGSSNTRYASTISNITSLVISASANAIGIGSTFRLYRRK